MAGDHYRSYEGGLISGGTDADGNPHGDDIQFILDDGTSFVGSMKKGQEHGDGVINYPTGWSVEGTFRHGAIVSGVVRNPDGDIVYRGAYDAVLTYHGTGTQYLDRSTYVGNFCCGKKYGQGVMTYGNGDRYDGNWAEDCRDGVGEYHFHGDDRAMKSIVGRWVNDRLTESITLKFDLPCESRSTKFVGEYEEGVKHGFGEMTYIDGDCYIGDWANDKREGLGELRFSEDNTVIAVLSGKWVNDKPVSPMTLTVNKMQLDKMTNVANEETGVDAKVNETKVTKVSGENSGDQPHVTPGKFKWICDICNKAKFHTYKEAVEHEMNCIDGECTEHMCT